MDMRNKNCSKLCLCNGSSEVKATAAKGLKAMSYETKTKPAKPIIPLYCTGTIVFQVNSLTAQSVAKFLKFGI